MLFTFPLIGEPKIGKQEIAKQNSHRQGSQRFGFPPRWNHGHTAKAAGSEHGSIGVRSDSNIRIESEIGGAAEKTMANFWQRSKKRFHTFEIYKSRIGRGSFHARRKRLRTIQQSSMRHR